MLRVRGTVFEKLFNIKAFGKKNLTNSAKRNTFKIIL